MWVTLISQKYSFELESERSFENSTILKIKSLMFSNISWNQRRKWFCCLEEDQPWFDLSSFFLSISIQFKNVLFQLLLSHKLLQ